MGLWNVEGVPHKGWKCIGVADLGEYAAADEEIEYAQCEMCGKESIRYVHRMKHPDYPDVLHVGCVCAGNMSDDYVTPRIAENELENKAARWKNFDKGQWKYNPTKQSYSRKYKGIYITIVKSRYGCYGIFLGGKRFWSIRGNRILDVQKAKRAAFSLYESYVKWKKNVNMAS